MNDIVKFITKIGLSPTWALVVIILVFCLLNYDKVRSIISDFVWAIAKTIGCCKRDATKRKLEKICNKSIASICDETNELDLPELKIKWIGKDNGNIVLNNNEAIAFLKFNIDNTQNIINATSAYVRKAILPISKTYMPSQIREAIDFTVIKKCLLEISEYRLAVNDFINNSHELCSANQDAIDKICNIDDAGLMSRILFREYFEWGNRLVGRSIDKKYEQEASDFLNFLYEITSRGYDDETKLQHISENIKVGVLLVAKYDTYSEQGEAPYVRRIKEGFAKGIRTFYLLARNEKLDIVGDVYSKLIKSGDFNLLNGPKVYKDAQGRDNICYCIEVNSNGDMAQTFTRVSNAISNNSIIEAVITSVFVDKMICIINNVKIILPHEKITDIQDLKLKYYFKPGMTVEVIPEEIDSSGNVIGSMLQTNSNPQRMVNDQFSVEGEVTAIVEESLDNCIFLRVKGSDIQAFAYRKDVTFSNYIFLHEHFPIGNEYQFRIIDIDYISNKLHLQLSNLIDPWTSIDYHIGQNLICKVLQKKDNCIVTEIKEGIKAILPFTEITWFNSEFAERKRFKINDDFPCRIKSINTERRIVILTIKPTKSPYIDHYDKVNNQGGVVDAKVISSDSKGLICLSEEKYRIFVPQSETHIGPNYYKIKLNNNIKVRIKAISDDHRSFIGTLKPFIEHPMQWFFDNYDSGVVLSHLTINTINDKSVLLNIKQKNKPHCLGILPIGEVSNLCYIDSVKPLFKDGRTFPMIITEIDMEQCIVKLSLKKLLSKNANRIGTLNYEKVYKGYITGYKNTEYVLIIENVWIEGLLVNACHHNVGDYVNVRPISLREIPEFTEDV